VVDLLDRKRRGLKCEAYRKQKPSKRSAIAVLLVAPTIAPNRLVVGHADWPAAERHAPVSSNVYASIRVVRENNRRQHADPAAFNSVANTMREPSILMNGAMVTDATWSIEVVVRGNFFHTLIERLRAPCAFTIALALSIQGIVHRIGNAFSDKAPLAGADYVDRPLPSPLSSGRS
jgi:hypothetical protein